VRHRCVECRAGTNIFLVILLVWVAGQYGFSVFLALFSVCLCDWTGGEGGGGRDSTTFLLFSFFIWRVGTIEMVGGCI
jgi:hypothetical protein